MICSNPHRQDGFEFGCGSCLPCRINRGRLWTARLLLESTQHAASSFVTLTYNDEHLPEGGTLCPEDLVKFWKRLRKSTGKTVRYFAVGEYGERSWRPHYHLALFGAVSRTEIEKSWTVKGSQIGHVDITGLGPESCAYITGYIQKGMMSKKDLRLSGRYPEFSRMSRRPGIGAGAVRELEAFYGTRLGSKILAERGDVGASFRTDGKMYPLGRYLRDRIRSAAGFTGVPAVTRAVVQRGKLEDLKVPEVVLKQENRRLNSARKAAFRQSLCLTKRVKM